MKTDKVNGQLNLDNTYIHIYAISTIKIGGKLYYYRGGSVYMSYTM